MRAVAADQGESRDRALSTYGVIGGPRRRELDALVTLAAQLAGVPYAAVNLLSSHSQHQVATAGFDGGDSPVEYSLCREVVESGLPMMMQDAGRDERFVDNPWTTDEATPMKFFAAHPLRTPAGVVIGTLCVYDHVEHPVSPDAAESLALLADRVVDLLELELTARLLRVANARLHTSNERLEHFAAQVSHDLKNPLTSVSLSLEALELEVAEPYQVDTVARARRGVDRMNRLIDNLLDFATQGGSPGEDLVDLAAEADLALDDLAGHVVRDAVRVGALPSVPGDAAQLRSVLMNLIDNAAKFTDDGERPEIEVVATALEGRSRIEVRDRGRGVPVAARERIFAPLARLDKSVAGAGIGLATCRRVVEAHGGSIGVTARAGGGSVFWFDLPAVDPPVPTED